MGVSRTTFIIGEDGTIEKIIEKVKTKEHTKQIFKELELYFFYKNILTQYTNGSGKKRKQCFKGKT